MSHQWSPTDPPMAGLTPGSWQSKIVNWVNSQLKSLHEHMHRPPFDLEVSYAPIKAPEDGMMVYADGTKWNPGSGRGLYYYKVNTWKFIA